MRTECDRSLIKGSWKIGTVTGQILDLINLSDDDIDFNAIIHSLSLQCRYGGHVAYHYSVAQHSLYVSEMVYLETKNERAAFAGLIHDFSEGLLQDLIRGIKVGIYEATDAYHDVEASVQQQIARLCGLHDYDDYHDVVKKWDNGVLRTEMETLCNPCAEQLKLLSSIQAAPIAIVPWSCGMAKSRLAKRFERFRKVIK